MTKYLPQFVKFMAVGLPAFAIAVPLNYLLVNHAEWPKPAAYAFVLVVQVSLNFVLCRRYVFKNRSDMSLWKQYFWFMQTIMAFRLADWGIYTLAVTYTPIPYLAAQIFNVALFAIFKFVFSKKILEG